MHCNSQDSHIIAVEATQQRYMEDTDSSSSEEPPAPGAARTRLGPDWQEIRRAREDADLLASVMRTPLARDDSEFSFTERETLAGTPPSHPDLDDWENRASARGSPSSSQLEELERLRRK